MTSLWRWTGIGLIATSLVGCYTLETYTLDVSRANETNDWSWPPRNIIDTQDVSLFVEVQNEVKTGYSCYAFMLPVPIPLIVSFRDPFPAPARKPISFPLLVGFKTSQSGLSFEANGMRLRVDDQVVPAAYTLGPQYDIEFPVGADWVHRVALPHNVPRIITSDGPMCGTNPYRKPSGIEAAEAIAETGEWHCYSVFFNISPLPPEKKFLLEITGLTRDGSPVQIPPIHFEKSEYKARYQVGERGCPPP